MGNVGRKKSYGFKTSHHTVRNANRSVKNLTLKGEAKERRKKGGGEQWWGVRGGCSKKSIDSKREATHR